jgi:RNA polymerase sigma factor (sigma-70 family)
VPATGSELRVVVCDEHRLLREALCAYLNQQPAVAAAIGVADADTAVRECRAGADVLVLDLRTGTGAPGMDVLEALLNLGVNTPVLTIGAAADLDAAARALLLGALGHCTKDSRPQALRDAVYAVAARQQSLPDETRDQILHRVRSLEERVKAAAQAIASLTTREREVLRLLALGLNRSQIAERLRLSPHTVRTHLARVMAKLGVNSQVAATALAHRLYQDMHSPKLLDRQRREGDALSDQPGGHAGK